MNILKTAVSLSVCLMAAGCGVPYSVEPKMLATADEEYVCGFYGYSVEHGDQQKTVALRVEIDRRQLIAPDEWPTILAHKVKIGMSQCGMRASWGFEDHHNATMTAHGTSIQYIYPGTYVYTDGKTVTAIQN